MSGTWDMLGRTPRKRDRVRTVVISTLLLVSLLMVGLLSQQTYQAITSHQQLASEVVHDYASLAAEEFANRYRLVSYYGFFPVLGVVSQVPADTVLPAPEALPSFAHIDSKGGKERLYMATGLAVSLFRYHPDTPRLEWSGQAVPASASDYLIESLLRPEAAEKGNPFAAAHTVVDGVAYNFVYARFSEKAVVGLLVDNETFGEWISFLIERNPLLPRSLTGSDGDDRVEVFAQLRDTNDQVVFETGSPHPLMITASRSVGVRVPALYSGLTATTGIDPDAASRLIIGGLPSGRLSLVYGSTGVVLGGMWAVAALMILMAIYLLSRERNLAHLRADSISRVSHELRTPLAQIRMFAETLLLDRVRTDEERKRALLVIDKEARRLSHLVENVLQFSRNERGGTKLNLTAQPLFSIVRDLADRFRPLMKGGRLVLASEVGDDVKVNLDVDAFSQMFANLVDNAVKYSPSGADVAVSLTKQSGRVRLAVEDSGPGIPQAERERIWEAYYRADVGDGLEIAGTGIGLAVVRELARQHDAETSVTDRAGGGARFVIDFAACEDKAA